MAKPCARDGRAQVSCRGQVDAHDVQHAAPFARRQANATPAQALVEADRVRLRVPLEASRTKLMRLFGGQSKQK